MGSEGPDSPAIVNIVTLVLYNVKGIKSRTIPPDTSVGLPVNSVLDSSPKYGTS